MQSFTRRQRRGIVIAAVGAIAAAALTGARVRADVLYWDPNGAAAPNPAGGTGTWSAAGATWWNGAGVQAYNVGAQPHDAIFGSSGGGVSISGAVTARSVTFDTGAYTLSGGTLTLADAGIVSVTNAADTAAVTSTISGATLTKTGAGKLVLSGANT